MLRISLLHICEVRHSHLDICREAAAASIAEQLVSGDGCVLKNGIAVL
jgi:hypothetical protein